MIVRLNRYGHGGTLPDSSRYADFALRCGNFVERSSVHIWVIANEPNVAVERRWRRMVNISARQICAGVSGVPKSHPEPGRT